MNEDIKPGDGLFRPKHFAERNANAVGSEPALRWLLFNSATNGLDEFGAILRLGRRVLIDEARFFAWLRARALRTSPLPTPARRAAARAALAGDTQAPAAVAAKSGGE